MADTRKQNEQTGNQPERQGNLTETDIDLERQNKTGTTGTEQERQAGQNPRRVDQGTERQGEGSETSKRPREEGI